MIRALVAAIVGVIWLSACGASPAATKQYRSPAGYTLSYPASWHVKTSTERTFSAAAPDGGEYMVVVVLDETVEDLLRSHREELAKVSDRNEVRQAQAGSGPATELWSSRQERDGRVGIYQQYFVPFAGGAIWVQHGCFEPGPEAENESADRDCDDAGAALVGSLKLS